MTAELAKTAALAQAVAQRGLSVTPPAGDALAQAVVGEALAYCRRDDVPDRMVPVLARLIAARMGGDDGDAALVKAGDTEVRFGAARAGAELLKEFRRL